MKSFARTETVEKWLGRLADFAVGWPLELLGITGPLSPTVDYQPIYKQSKFLSVDAANDRIRKLIDSRDPFFVGRLGSTELRAVLRTHLRGNRNALQKVYAAIARLESPVWTQHQYRNLQTQSGFYPLSEELTDRFTQLMIESMQEVDLLGSWVPGENIFSASFSQATITKLESLEPFNAKRPWTEALAGKKVLVVHPFSKTIAAQFERHREKLYPGTSILPEFDIETLQAVQSLSGPVEGFQTWFDALDFMFEDCVERDFDIALLGCGAYGFPLASRLKKAGKKVVHLGGVTQILFGIKGKRWDSRRAYRDLYNDFWTRPSAEETPRAAKHVDGGVYW